MARRMVQNNLLKNSVSAYFAAIEIHNKPGIAYRYETVTLLMMNAWELLLKAFIKKYVKNKSIFENRKGGHTISIDRAIVYTDEYFNSKEPKSFMAIKENLNLIEEYRNNIVHFYCEQLEPYIFMLTAKAAINYAEFTKKYFNRDIMGEEGLFILPLGFKLPFRPEDFLTKKAAKYVSSKESKEFISSMVKIISDLSAEGVEEGIVVGFDIYLESVKKMTNSDLKIAITGKDEADGAFTKIQKVQLTNDKSAQKVALSDEEIFKMFPLYHGDVCRICREKIKEFKQNKEFNDIMGKIKKEGQYCHTRKLNPKSENGASTTMYSEEVIEQIQKLYSSR